jgi:hypothetical protein
VERQERLLDDYIHRDLIPGIDFYNSSIRIPIKDEYGRYGYFDLSYLLPWGQLTDYNPIVSSRGYAPSNPLLVLYSDARAGTNLFLDRPLGYSHDTPLESKGRILKHMLEIAEPGIVASTRKTVDKLIMYPKDYKGRNHSVGEVMADYFCGLKLRRVDFNELLDRRMKECSKLTASVKLELENRINEIEVQSSLSPEQKQKQINKAMKDAEKDFNRILDLKYYYQGYDKEKN